MRPSRPVCSALAVVVCAAALVGCSSDEDEAREALQAFLEGWPAGELDSVRFITPTGSAIASPDVAEQVADLSGELAELEPRLSIDGISVTEDVASAEVSFEWPLPGGASWSYQNPVRLSERDDDWRVIWEPAVIHPDLIADDQLTIRRTTATRGDILDGDGDPLVTNRGVVDVGIEPRRVTNIDALVAALDDAFRSVGVDLDMSDLPDRVEEADDSQFVYVVTLRQADYDPIRDQIRPLDGTVFREHELPLAPTRTFARALLGTVDQATAEDLENNPDSYVAGDLVGHGGLQERYDEQLRGVAGQTVVIARPAPDDEINEIELHQRDPVPGTDLSTTLDVEVQNAAERALATESNRSALVAIRVSDGAVLAVANDRGDAETDVNLALTAAVPPGSTFKMVTAYRLLSTGEVTLDATVPCPREHSVGGMAFHNDDNFALGDVPFRTAVAASCNTAFTSLAPQLGAGGLAAAGADLGLGGDWDLGIETFTGEVSTGGSEAERAAAAFGQGTTQVSPAAMAAATAAVARGAWLPPTLVDDPEAPAAEPASLDRAAIEDLHSALRAVVTEGTAEALADVPGADVHGKTGTAEYDDESEAAHGWFVGWQDDLAVAVFVEDGGSGSGTAVPVAEHFLRELT